MPLTMRMLCQWMVISWLACFSGPSLAQVEALRINEVVADNTRSNPFTEGLGPQATLRYRDWIEIYNPTGQELNLKGLYLTDNELVPDQWVIGSWTKITTTPDGEFETPQLHDVLVPPGGFVTLWCDGGAPTLSQAGQPYFPERHATFRLSRQGEHIGIYQKVGQELVEIDGFDFPYMPPDIAYGRSPDGGAELGYILEPTPDSSNGAIEPNPPLFANATRYGAVLLVGGSVAQQRGLIPQATDHVNVRAEVNDENKAAPNAGVASVTLYYRVDGGSIASLKMKDDGKSDDKLPRDGVYGAFIPPQPQGSLVEFWIGAVDVGGASDFDPDHCTGATCEEGPEGARPFAYRVGGSPLRGGLFLNEAAARNREGDCDNLGEFDDWVELFNALGSAVTIRGLYLTNNELDLDKWPVPERIPLEDPGGEPTELVPDLDPQGHVLIWCDNDARDELLGKPGQDALVFHGEFNPCPSPPGAGWVYHLHTNFNLNGGGDRIILVDSDGASIIDVFEFGPQVDGFSFGRMPDGEVTMGRMCPTPRNLNGEPYDWGCDGWIGIIPEVEVLGYSPLRPKESNRVTVRARVADDEPSQIARVEVRYRVNNTPLDPFRFDMRDDGVSPDAAAGDGIYTGTIPSQPDGSIVTFWVEVEDGDGNIMKDPLIATYIYAVAGLGQPDYVINEVVAASRGAAAAAYRDEEGDIEDWVEIYNKTTADIEIGGWHLSDNPLQKTKWAFPDGTVLPRNGYVLVVCDGEIDEGPFHASFNLNGDGDELLLVKPDGVEVVDALELTVQCPDASAARVPNGSAFWAQGCVPTPGGRNPSEPIRSVWFIRGDLNGDTKVGLTDAILLLSILFLPVGSRPDAECVKAGDFDDNGTLELADVIRLLVFIFATGPPPATPFPEPWCDPTPDVLPCGAGGGT